MKTMSCHRTKRSTAKSHLSETPACSRSRSFQGKAQQEQRQLTFGDQKMRGGGRRREGDGRSTSTTPRTRRSTRAAKNTRVSYKDVGDVYSSDESDGSVWDELGLSESDLSEDNRRRRKVRRSIPTRRSKRAPTKKRFTSGHDAVSSSEEESDDFINDSETTNASSSSDDSSQEVKQHKNRTRTKSRSRRVTEDMKRESDEDVAVSSSAKKRKKSSAQLVSSDDEEEGQQRRRRRIIVASDSSDSSDDGCTEMNKTEGCAQSERKSEEIGPMSDKTDVKQETSELATSVGNGQPNHQHCAGEKDEESSPKYAAAVSKGADKRILSDKRRVSVKTKSSNDRKDKSSKSRRARTSSIQDKQQTALERLKRQRDRKKQGINKNMCESDEEEEEEEEEETEVISSESEDSFIVPDDESDEEEDEPEVQEDEDSVGEIVHQEKKTQFQSWVELMLCANLQDNPGEYLRTARFNTDIPDDTRDNVAQVLHRLQDATNLVFSTAWRRSFKEAIEMHPFYSNQPSSHRWMDCQACGRPDHHISQTISLKGTPYDRETFEDDDFGNYEKSYDVGCFCQERSELYHGLYHFRYRVFHTCKAEAEKSLAFLRDEGEEDPDDDKVIDRCLKDPDWIDELFNEMAGLIEDVHQQYTADYSKPWKAV
ncbi:CCDC82 [Branchiostoma lanceolatum]|uniref:CCDC82 protein n=2 Tax=Branchiostoma lanceolatum TaxID=7740 RepID=A0A8J9ZR10_BRALA|nr:CCDC82 [Branchiostoma lanceolatum]